MNKRTLEREYSSVCLVVVVHGFDLDVGYSVREVALVTPEGQPRDDQFNGLLKFKPDTPFQELSDSDRQKVQNETRHVHGLLYKPWSDKHFGPQEEFIHCILEEWDQKRTPDKETIAFHGHDKVAALLREKGIPLIRPDVDLKQQPVGTVNVFADSDFSEWCRDHDAGAMDVWHDSCARVLAVKLANYIKRQLSVKPTREELNRQRVLWQRRCDKLLDKLLCEYCIDDKDDAFEKGRGMDWRPTDCSECRIIRYILDEFVTDEEHDIPSYADDRVYTMWRWDPKFKFYNNQ